LYGRGRGKLSERDLKKTTKMEIRKDEEDWILIEGKKKSGYN